MVDLTDLDLFAHGFPHEVFTQLRRDAPVMWHEPTEHTPDGEGFGSHPRGMHDRGARSGLLFVGDGG